MLLTRAPSPALRPFVKLLWASAPATGGSGGPPQREHVLPTGDMHLALRLSGAPLRVFASAQDPVGSTMGFAVVGGARSAYYAREAGPAGHAVGVQLRAGAAGPLFGVPASALAQAHTPLSLLWGSAADQALDRLAAEADPQRRLDLLEALLARRLGGAALLPPAIAAAMQALDAGSSVAQAVQRSGYSHRHCIALFEQATGLTPKIWSRVQRFQRVLRNASAQAGLPGAALALDAGFSDQPHFQREFLAFAGLTPQAWRRAAPAHPHHVRLG